MTNEFLSFTNLFTYLGFNIAAFAFLSQYLTFPKDLLSELHRVNRNDSHELPIKGSNIIEKDVKNDAAIKLKIFFLEHDTITFIMLSYILFSILIVMLLMGFVRLQNEDYFIFQILLVYLPITYFLFLCILTYFNLGKKNKIRDWPQGYNKDKIFLMFAILTIHFIILGILSFFAFNDKFGKILYVNIFGLICLFIYYLIILAKRMPVSHLLALWELLNTERNNQSTD